MSCQGSKLDLCIAQGKTFAMTLRWAAEPYIYRPITTIHNSAPLRAEVIGHGMPDGWMFAFSAIQGPVDLNAQMSPPGPDDYRQAKVIGPDEIEVNAINGALLKPYRSGGFIQYLTPVSLAGKSARMDIRDKVGGNLLLSLHSGDDSIVLDDTEKTISLRLEHDITRDIAWRRGVHEIEIFDAVDVFRLAYGAVTVSPETTTSE